MTTTEGGYYSLSRNSSTFWKIHISLVVSVQQIQSDNLQTVSLANHKQWKLGRN